MLLTAFLASYWKMKSINQLHKVCDCNMKEHQRAWKSTVLPLWQKVSETRMPVKNSSGMWSSLTCVCEYMYAGESLFWAFEEENTFGYWCKIQIACSVTLPFENMGYQAPLLQRGACLACRAALQSQTCFVPVSTLTSEHPEQTRDGKYPPWIIFINMHT